MTLIICCECGGQVSTKASTCPHCGAPVELSAREPADASDDDAMGGEPAPKPPPRPPTQPPVHRTATPGPVPLGASSPTELAQLYAGFVLGFGACAAFVGCVWPTLGILGGTALGALLGAVVAGVVHFCCNKFGADVDDFKGFGWGGIPLAVVATAIYFLLPLAFNWGMETFFMGSYVESMVEEIMVEEEPDLTVLAVELRHTEKAEEDSERFQHVVWLSELKQKKENDENREKDADFSVYVGTVKVEKEDQLVERPIRVFVTTEGSIWSWKRAVRTRLLSPKF